jgi:tetratricopeptide (TPR) repeat protein
MDALTRGEEAERRGDLVAAVNAYTAARDGGDARVASAATFRLGRVAWRQGRFDEALALYERARGVAAQLGDDELLANAENGIGALHCERGAYVQARASYHVALERTSDASLRGRILLNLGVLANIEGDLDDARARYQKSIAEFERASNEEGLALAQHNLGMLHADRRDWAAAAESYERCLAISERLGMRQMVANVLLNRAEMLCARNLPDEARSSCDRALALFGELGDQVGRAESHRWQGRALVQLGDAAAAKHWLEEAVRLARQLGVPLLEAEASRDLGAMCLASGDRDDARSWLERALEKFTGLGAKREAGEVTAELEQLRKADWSS